MCATELRRLVPSRLPGGVVGADEFELSPTHYAPVVGVGDEVVVDPSCVAGQIGGIQLRRFGDRVEFTGGDEAIELFFAAKVGVDPFLAGLGRFRDPIDARTGDPVPREFGRGRFDNAVTRRIDARRGRHSENHTKSPYLVWPRC